MAKEAKQGPRKYSCFKLVCLGGLWLNKKKKSHSVVSDSLRPHGLYSPPRSFVHGIFQARILEWVAISFSRESSQPRDQTLVCCIAGRCFTVRAIAAAAKWLQSYPTLCDPIDGSLPGSPVPGIPAAHQAPPSLGFSRQEHWSGLPFPSPMQESEK